MRIKLSVEALEARWVPAFLVEDYGQFTLTGVGANGTDSGTCAGLHTATKDYEEGGAPYEVDINPYTPEAKDGFSGEELGVLTARFPGWWFNFSSQTLADNSLIVKDYEAQVTDDWVGGEF